MYKRDTCLTIVRSRDTWMKAVKFKTPKSDMNSIIKPIRRPFFEFIVIYRKIKDTWRVQMLGFHHMMNRSFRVIPPTRSRPYHLSRLLMHQLQQQNQPSGPGSVLHYALLDIPAP